MATEISGRNYEITPEIREMVETKLAKIEERLFDDVIDVRVVLQVEKYRNICEILIKGKEHDVKTVQESDESMQDAVNSAIDHVKRQAQKNRKKIRDHHRNDGNGIKDVNEWNVQVLEPGRLRSRECLVELRERRTAPEGQCRVQATRGDGRAGAAYRQDQQHRHPSDVDRRGGAASR